MIDIKYNDDYSYSDIYMMDGLHSSIEIYTHDDSGKVIQLSNEQIHLESFEINQSICSGSDLVFGGCESAYCKFTVTSDFPSLVGKYIWIQSTLTNESIEPSRVDNYISLGSYRIVSDEWSANRVSRNITAYDKMYELQTINMYKWYESLNFPVSVGDMRKSALDYIKLNDDTKDKTYCNDAVKISKVNGLSDLTAADVFRFISEMSGGFGIINIRGYFDIINLKNDSVYTYTSSHIKNMNYEDSKSEKIKMIYCENEKSYTYITNTNENGIIYPIQNTKLLKNTSVSTINTLLRNINTVIKDIDYQKFNCDFRGNPCLEIGDKIAYQSEKDNFNGYLTERRIKGIHSITDTASCQNKYANRDLPDNEEKDEGVISSDPSVGGGGINILNCYKDDMMENVPEDTEDGEIFATREMLWDKNKLGFLHDIDNLKVFLKQHANYTYTILDNLSDYGKGLQKVILTPYNINQDRTANIINIKKSYQYQADMTYYNGQPIVDYSLMNKVISSNPEDYVLFFPEAHGMKPYRIANGPNEEQHKNPLICEVDLGTYKLKAVVDELYQDVDQDLGDDGSMGNAEYTTPVSLPTEWCKYWCYRRFIIRVRFYINDQLITSNMDQSTRSTPTGMQAYINRNYKGFTTEDYAFPFRDGFEYLKETGDVRFPTDDDKRIFRNTVFKNGAPSVGAYMYFAWCPTQYDYQGRTGKPDSITTDFDKYRDKNGNISTVNAYSRWHFVVYDGSNDIAKFGDYGGNENYYKGLKTFFWQTDFGIADNDIKDMEGGPSGIKEQNPEAGGDYSNCKEIVITKDWEINDTSFSLNELNNFSNCEILRIGLNKILNISDKALQQMTNLKKVYYYGLDFDEQNKYSCATMGRILNNTNVEYIKYSRCFDVPQDMLKNGKNIQGGSFILAYGCNSPELTIDAQGVHFLFPPTVAGPNTLQRLNLVLAEDVTIYHNAFASVIPPDGLIFTLTFKNKINLTLFDENVTVRDVFPAFSDLSQLLIRFPQGSTGIEEWCTAGGVNYEIF